MSSKFYLTYSDEYKLCTTCRGLLVAQQHCCMYKMFKLRGDSFKTRDDAIKAAKIIYKGYSIYSHVGDLLYGAAKNAKTKLNFDTLVRQEPAFIPVIADISETQIKQEASLKPKAIENVKENTDIDSEPALVQCDPLYFDAFVQRVLRLDVNELTHVLFDYDMAIACVDGAFKDKRSGYAYVMIAGGTCYQDSAEFICENGNSTKAEILAAKQAIAKAAALGVKKLILCYDCSAIANSILSPNKSSIPEINEYKEFCRVMSELISIHFVKIKGHSGIPLHTKADVLAGIKVGRDI